VKLYAFVPNLVLTCVTYKDKRICVNLCAI